MVNASRRDLEELVERRNTEAVQAHNRGWALTPLRGKKPVLPGWTSLPRPSLDQVRRWARSGNVGLRTGALSGVFVIDVDPSKGGHAAALALPRTVTVVTGGGGIHLYFIAPAESLGNSTSKLGHGIDTRGEGGQVVFVGSLHPDSGEAYRWAPGLSPDEVPLATLPDHLVDLLRVPANLAANGPTPAAGRGEAYAAAALRDEAEKVRSAVESTRNNTLNVAAFNLGQLIAAGLLDDEAITHTLLQAARDAGLGEGEAMATIRSGLTAGRTRPRAATEPRPSSGKPQNVRQFDKGRPSQRAAGSGAGNTAALPVIDAGDGNLPRMASEAWKAVQRANDPPRWFRFGDLPSRIQRDDKKILIVRELTKDRMRYLLARVATWVRFTDGQPKEVHPPTSVVNDMLACPEPPLPVLTRIVEAPIFAPDGTLCLEPGYHPANRTYYAPTKGFAVPPISDHPTSAELDHARSLLLDDLLIDFPFTGDPERANAVALALLPFVRDLIDGATPLHLLEKPSPGTGATLLVDVLLYPALGHSVATMTEGGNEEEWRKRLTAKLMQAPTAILIDNIRLPLEASALASAITSATWEDRILGVSLIARVPVRCAWVATGNNPIISNEMARRAIRIRLDAKVDQPWLRKSFKHPKLRKWVREHRSDLVWALLTLVRGWIVAGRPQPPEPRSLGMFEDWSQIVGGIVAYAGIDGFLGNLDSFYLDADTESSALRTFVALWFEKYRDRVVGVADLLSLVLESDLFDLGEGNERSQRTRLGKLIGKQRDRQFGVFRVVAAGEVRGSGRWRLEQVNPGSPEK